LKALLPGEKLAAQAVYFSLSDHSWPKLENRPEYEPTYPSETFPSQVIFPVLHFGVSPAAATGEGKIVAKTATITINSIKTFFFISSPWAQSPFVVGGGFRFFNEANLRSKSYHKRLTLSSYGVFTGS